MNDVKITDSILVSMKKLLGAHEVDNSYDFDIMVHTNTVFNILTRMGVGPSKGFKITGESETWTDFTNDDILFNSVITYVYLKVKMVFDPPVNSTAVESFKSMIAELEWTLANTDINRDEEV